MTVLPFIIKSMRNQHTKIEKNEMNFKNEVVSDVKLNFTSNI